MDAEGRLSDRSVEEKPKVNVRAVAAHSAFGKNYEIGDEYEVDAEYVETLKVQGKAYPTEEYPAPAPSPAPPENQPV